MARMNWTRRGFLPSLVVVAVLLPAVTLGAPRQQRLKAGQYNPADATVEMFAAIDAGDIEVKLIPKDATKARVLIKNKTARPLNVKLPDAFAGVPVLAQGIGLPGAGAGGGAGLGGGGRRDRGDSGSQTMGGGMGGMGGGMMGGMGGGGFMNVKPEAVGDLRVPTVCLEHGKKDPRPHIPYAIKPISAFTDKAEVHELCRLVGTGRLSQRAAQAAAWHFSDSMSWQELAAKELHFANGTRAPYFAPAELQAAMEIASAATRMAKEREKTRPEKVGSLSQQP